MAVKDFCFVFGVKAARKALGMHSLISSVPYATRTLYKNVPSVRSDDCPYLYCSNLFVQ